MEGHQLQQVDTVIFGHDKFAFEMVHFVKNASNQITNDKSVKENWEILFIQGLECLLVECAVVNDDIERDCFVSRVYCWFTEKLSERRELPRKSTTFTKSYYLFIIYICFIFITFSTLKHGGFQVLHQKPP